MASLRSSTVKMPASAFPVDGSALDKLDKRLSTPIFRLRIGIVLEVLSSVPGCFFGMPAFHIASPVLAALLCGGKPTTEAGPWLVFLACTGLLLSLWFAAQASSPIDRRLFKILYSPISLIAAPAVGCSLLEVLLPSDANAKSAAYFHLVGWYLSIMWVLHLKARYPRRRPAVCEDIRDYSKSLSNIVAMLRSGDPGAAFPSGDVAGSVTFAYPVLRCWSVAAAGAAASSPALPGAAIACVLLSAFGRMYFLAHHALDVTVGALLAASVCAAVDVTLSPFSRLAALPASTAGSTSCTCEVHTPWWHAVAALALLAVFAKVTNAKGAAPAQK